jgi:methyl-accepting chemotaxis protein
MSTVSTQPPGPAAPRHEGEPGHRHRRFRNYLVDTSLQLRLASYLLAVAALLSIGLGWLLWQAWQETSRVIALGAPDSAETLASALANEDRGRMVLVGAAMVGVLLGLLAAAVVITHRIAGPAFAIGRTCRQVAEGNLSHPRPLRSHDLLLELGDEVTAMVEALRGREAGERAVAAAAALEKLAEEKEGRLRG